MNLKGHFQTIIPALFRKPVPMVFVPEEILTPDGDFLEADWYCQGSEKLVILCHGMEGNSKRPYMLGMARAFFDAGFDCLAWNFRSCGTRMNRKQILYHSGASYDLDTVVAHALTNGYTEIFLVGFSLGGNLTLKYLGEMGEGLSPLIKKAVVFSVPCDLSAGSKEIDQWFNKVYSRRFIKSLKNKMLQKAGQFPDIKKMLPLLENMDTIFGFDDAFTAPLHGFKDAADYYQKNSSKYFIKKIRVETLIVNALNDPFLPEECYPVIEAGNNPYVNLEMPAKGGHCGFFIGKGLYWSEMRAVDFCKEQ